MATGAVFVSYRRENTGHAAGRLADVLISRYGHPRAFIDVESIEPGHDFADEINCAISGCAVLPALIGPRWITITAGKGRGRLENPRDYGVLEIADALHRGIKVIPVLVDGVPMPDTDLMPPGLQTLGQRNAIRLNYETFRSDTEGLIRVLRLPSKEEISRRTLVKWVAGGLAAAVGGLRVAAVVQLQANRPVEPLWTFQTGDEVYSSPAVAGGTVYIGSVDARLYALDTGSGKPRWSYQTNGAITSTPAVSGETVYVGSNDMKLHGVETAGGSRAGPSRPGRPCIPRRQSTADWCASAAGTTGYTPWTPQRAKSAGLTLPRAPWISPPSSPLAWCILSSDDPCVDAFQAASGEWVCSFGADQGVVSTSCLLGKVLYVESDHGNLYALDSSRGRKRWRFGTGNGIRSSPTVAGTVVYVGSRDDRGHAQIPAQPAQQQHDDGVGQRRGRPDQNVVQHEHSAAQRHRAGQRRVSAGHQLQQAPNPAFARSDKIRRRRQTGTGVVKSQPIAASTEARTISSSP
nr:PQQ-binding-like beta-propeller repeat protein [Arthrobacter sp. H14-L1]